MGRRRRPPGARPVAVATARLWTYHHPARTIAADEPRTDRHLTASRPHPGPPGRKIPSDDGSNARKSCRSDAAGLHRPGRRLRAGRFVPVRAGGRPAGRAGGAGLAGAGRDPLAARPRPPARRPRPPRRGAGPRRAGSRCWSGAGWTRAATAEPGALRRDGGFRPLGTTWPAMSPVGWSTFATGVDASGHNIFDFLSRDKLTHLPVLSSTRLATERPHASSGRCACRAAATRSNRCSAASRSGPPAPKRASPPASCACRSPSRRTGSAASCCRRCACPICAARRARSPTSREPGATATGDDAGATTGGVRLDADAVRPDGAGTGALPGPTRPTGRAADHAGHRDGRPRRGAGDLHRSAGRRSRWAPTSTPPGSRSASGAARQQAHGICKLRVTSFAPRFSFYVTPLHIDPRQTGRAHQQSAASGDGARAAARVVRHPGTGRGHLGAERARHRRAGLPGPGLRHPRRAAAAVLARAGPPRPRASSRSCSTPPTASSTCSSATSIPQHPANRGKDIERHKDAILDLYRRADELVGRDAGAPAQGRRAAGRLGPRLQAVPARREPQRLVPRERLPATSGAIRRGPAAGDPRGHALRGPATSTGRARAPTPTGWPAST